MSVTALPGSTGAMLCPAETATSTIGNAGDRFFSRIGAWMLEAIATSRMRRAARELQMLDDHLLKDIGITRTEIDSVVRYGRESGPSPIRAVFGLDTMRK